VEREQTELEGSIAEQTDGVKEERDAAARRLGEAKQRREDLEAQLVEARQVEAKETAALDALDAKIDRVRKRFDRQLQRLHDRLSQVGADERECERELSSLKGQRDEA